MGVACKAKANRIPEGSGVEQVRRSGTCSFKRRSQRACLEEVTPGGGGEVARVRTRPHSRHAGATLLCVPEGERSFCRTL